MSVVTLLLSDDCWQSTCECLFPVPVPAGCCIDERLFRQLASIFDGSSGQSDSPAIRTAFKNCGILSDAAIKIGAPGQASGSKQARIQALVGCVTNSLSASYQSSWPHAMAGDYT